MESVIPIATNTVHSMKALKKPVKNPPGTTRIRLELG